MSLWSDRREGRGGGREEVRERENWTDRGGE